MQARHIGGPNTRQVAVNTKPSGRSRSNFRQSDISRAIKAAVEAGMVVTGAEICQTGSIRLQFGAEAPQSTEDRELAEFRRQHGYC
jgi:hypothetical protein